MRFKYGFNRRLVLGAMVSAALGIGAAGCGTDSNLTDAEYVERAKEHQDKGELYASVIELKNALQKNADNPEARWLLGKVYLDLNDGAAAEKELARARELGIAPESIGLSLAQAHLLQSKYDDVLNDLSLLSGNSDRERGQIEALRGEALLGKHQFDEAESIFRKARELDAKLVEPLLGLARVIAIKGDQTQARSLIDQAVKLAPNSVNAWILLGDMERAQGKFPAADAAYTEALKLNKDHWQALSNRALVRVLVGQFDLAKKDIFRAKKIAPNFYAIHYAEGVLELRQKNYAQAQQRLEKALSFNQNFISGSYLLGIAHYQQQHWEQAEHMLGQVLKQLPGLEDAAILLGEVRLRRGDNAGAKQIVAEALRRNPESPRLLELMGTAYLDEGQTEQGIAYLNKAVALKPDLVDSHRKLAVGMLMQGQREKGVEQLELSLDLPGDKQRNYSLLFFTRLGAGDYAKAMELVTRMAKEYPKSPAPLNYTGLVKLAQKDVTGAKTAFEQNLKAHPGDPAAARELAAIALREGKIDQAKSYYQQIAKQYPNNAQAKIALAELDLGQGKVEAAKQILQKAVEQAPQDVLLRARLARLLTSLGDPLAAMTVIQAGGTQVESNPHLILAEAEAQIAQQQFEVAVRRLGQITSDVANSPNYYYLLGLAYGGQNKSREALQAFDLAVKSAPKYFAARVDRIRLLAVMGKAKEAQAALQGLEQDFGASNPEVLGMKGWLALQQKRPQEAIVAYRQALQAAPGGKLTILLSQAQLATGDQAGSVKTLEDWLKQHRDDVLVTYTLANVHLGLNKVAEAESGFKRVLELAPVNVVALNNLAWLQRKSNPSQALGYAEKAAQLAPNALPVKETLGVLLAEAGQIERAYPLLGEAVKTSPTPTNRYYLALVLSKRGEGAKAREALQKLLRDAAQFPERAEAQALLGKL